MGVKGNTATTLDDWTIGQEQICQNRPEHRRMLEPVPDWRVFQDDAPPQLTSATVLEVVGLWLAAEAKAGKKPSTMRSYRSFVTAHLASAFGAFDCRAVTPAILHAWLRAVAGVREAKTVLRLWSHHCVFWAFAKRVGAVDVDPTNDVPPGVLPTKRTANPRRGEGEVLSLLNITRLLFDQRIPLERRVFWALLLLAGMRLGEAAALCWAEYSIPAARLVVNRSWDCRARVFGAPKNGLPRRVPVHEHLGGLLSMWRYELEARLGRNLRPDDLLVPCIETQHGRPIAPRPWHQNTLIRRWRRDLALLGIASESGQPMRVHGCRRTFITQMRRAGVEKRLRKLMTHNSELIREDDAHDLYDHYAWTEFLTAIAKLQLDDSERMRLQRGPR